MKRILVFIIAIHCLVSAIATNRALVIGIGKYPDSGGWAEINGDKDVPVVRKMLLENGFKESDIITLVNQEATYAAVKNSFAKLIAKSSVGDVVYIHFSGHGQQITDVHGDEEDGFDEAWIPYDAGIEYKEGVYEGEKHILDDQLNRWLIQLRGKIGSNGKITVVADACHSGSGTRGDEIVRGSMSQFRIPGPKADFNSSNVNDVDWVFISACKSTQTNYEFQGMGRLTYAINQYANKLKSMTCEELMRGIKSTMKRIEVFTQTPTVDVKDNRKSISIF